MIFFFNFKFVTVKRNVIIISTWPYWQVVSPIYNFHRLHSTLVTGLCVEDSECQLGSVFLRSYFVAMHITFQTMNYDFNVRCNTEISEVSFENSYMILLRILRHLFLRSWVFANFHNVLHTFWNPIMFVKCYMRFIICKMKYIFDTFVHVKDSSKIRMLSIKCWFWAYALVCRLHMEEPKFVLRIIVGWCVKGMFMESS